MTRTDGGYFVRGNAVMQGGADREELVAVFTAPFVDGDPYVAWDLANDLNREGGHAAVAVPRRHGPTPYQRDLVVVLCDGTPVKALAATGELAFPERYARRARLRYARLLREWATARERAVSS